MGAHKHNPMAMAARGGMNGVRVDGKGPQNINVNIHELPRLGCKACGGTHFMRKVQLYEIPELLRFATSGNSTLFTEELVCIECGEANSVDQMRKLVPLCQEKAGTDSAQPAEDAHKPMIEIVKG
jgi:hypothetical protein